MKQTNKRKKSSKKRTEKFNNALFTKSYWKNWKHIEKCIGINRTKTYDRIEGTNTHSLGLWSKRTKPTRKLMAIVENNFCFFIQTFQWDFSRPITIDHTASYHKYNNKEHHQLRVKKILLCDISRYPKCPNPTRPIWLWTMDCGL